MRFRLFAFRIFALIGLAASAASLTDQLLDDGAFCSVDSGCDVVTNSVYARPLGIPLPVIGLIGFILVIGLSVVGRPWAERAARRCAAVAAVAGVTLIAVQLAVLDRVCPLCLVADGSALAIGILALVPFPASPCTALKRALWSVAAVVAVLAPITWAFSGSDPEPPDWVMEHWVEGKINVVELTDFECDHCQRADEYLRAALKNRTDVNLVRIAVAMPKHVNARPAALAYEAAKAQGRGEEMASALYAAQSRSPADCRRLAQRLGLSMEQYDRSVDDRTIDAAVAAHSKAAWATTSAVPSIWVQSHYIQGEPNPANFDAALRRARPYRAK
jgi:uncharacterized membrane protein